MRVVMAAWCVCGICVLPSWAQAPAPATPRGAARPAAPVPAPAPAPAPAPSPTATADAVVRLWIERWNALGPAADTLDAFVALYEPDALHIAGPTADQRGTATYRGHAGIRAMAAKIAAEQDRRTYRLETETARETTASLFHQTTGPWGGPAVAVQFVAAYTDRATQKRYVVPGALFLQLVGARIHRARVYLGDGERAEVEAEPTRKRP